MAKEAAYVPNILRQGRWVPWLYLGPALILMSIFILYPGLNTLYLSFRNQNGSDWAYTTCLAGQPCWGFSKTIAML